MLYMVGEKMSPQHMEIPATRGKQQESWNPGKPAECLKEHEPAGVRDCSDLLQLKRDKFCLDPQMQEGIRLWTLPKKKIKT